MRKIDVSRILCRVSELAAGTLVTPNVRLVRPLGEGGMGAVWVADHLALRTQVVVKFIADSLKANDEARERFSREAAAAAQVKSPHVVQTFDHGVTESGRPYIVMELLEGRDLARHLDAQGHITPETTLEIVAQLGMLLVLVALWRGRLIPIWPPVLCVVGILVDAVVGTIEATLVADALLLAVMVWVAILFARIPREVWLGTAEAPRRGRYASAGITSRSNSSMPDRS